MMKYAKRLNLLSITFFLPVKNIKQDNNTFAFLRPAAFSTYFQHLRIDEIHLIWIFVSKFMTF
jgi:hypothetical protein